MPSTEYKFVALSVSILDSDDVLSGELAMSWCVSWIQCLSMYISQDCQAQYYELQKEEWKSYTVM